VTQVRKYAGFSRGGFVSLAALSVPSQLDVEPEFRTHVDVPHVWVLAEIVDGQYRIYPGEIYSRQREGGPVRVTAKAMRSPYQFAERVLSASQLNPLLWTLDSWRQGNEIKLWDPKAKAPRKPLFVGQWLLDFHEPWKTHIWIVIASEDKDWHGRVVSPDAIAPVSLVAANGAMPPARLPSPELIQDGAFGCADLFLQQAAELRNSADSRILKLNPPDQN
jgi:hypothetical protein